MDYSFFFYLVFYPCILKISTYYSFFLTHYSFFSYTLFQLFWNKIIMHLVMPWFYHCRFTSLEPTRPEATSSRESVFQKKFFIRFMMERMDSVKVPEVSTADPLNQNKKSAAPTSFGKVPIIHFFLKSISLLLFSKLC